MGQNPAVRVWRPPFLTAASLEGVTPPAPHPGGLNAMTCVICGLGQLATPYDTAQEMLRRYEVARAVVLGIPVIVNPCRVEPEKGYAMFAGTADALLANPAVPTSLAEPAAIAPGERLIATVRHLAQAGRASSAPGHIACRHPSRI